MTNGGFVDTNGQLWPTCPECGKTHPCVELPEEQVEQIETWRRGLAQYSHRSDSSGYAGRMGEEVLDALFRARLANAALSIAYRRSIEETHRIAGGASGAGLPDQAGQRWDGLAGVAAACERCHGEAM